MASSAKECYPKTTDISQFPVNATVLNLAMQRSLNLCVVHNSPREFFCFTDNVASPAVRLFHLRALRHT